MKFSQEELDGARSRVAERFAVKAAPTVLTHIPAEVVRDAALNLARALDGDSVIMPRGDRLLIGLGVALAKNGRAGQGLAGWLAEAAKVAGKTDEEIEAVGAVALACATYNGYYKFRSLISDSKPFESFQPGLRASPFVRSSLGKTLVELISLAVSVMNGCTSCVNGHVETVKGGHLPNPEAAIDEAVRISGVVAALASWDHE